MKSDQVINVAFVVVAASATIISVIVNAIKGKKKQEEHKSVPRKVPIVTRPQVSVKPAGEEALLHDILGEKPLRSKLKEAQTACKQRQAEQKREEEPSSRLVPDRQEDQPDTRGGRYEPSLNTLSRFDVPEKVVAVEVSGERRPVRGAEVLRSMSRSELQQAIVLREILGPPVSLQ